MNNVMSLQRPATEMSALLARFQFALGPMDRWSDDALEELENWLVNRRLGVTHEWLKRDQDD